MPLETVDDHCFLVRYKGDFGTTFCARLVVTCNEKEKILTNVLQKSPRTQRVDELHPRGRLMRRNRSGQFAGLSTQSHERRGSIQKGKLPAEAGEEM